MTTPAMEEHIRLPSAGLREIVRRYVERRIRVEDEIALTLPIRPDLFIDFYLKDAPLIGEQGDRRRVPGADMLLVGPHARETVTAYLVGDLHYFSIQLQPAALNRLFGVAMPELVDKKIAAQDIIGATALRLRDAVAQAVDFDGRVTASERWFEGVLESARAANTVDEAARLIRRLGGAAPLRLLASQVGLSERQWRRNFTNQSGLSPKLFSSVVRLDATLERRRACPEMS